jgi:hypothetical protein
MNEFAFASTIGRRDHSALLEHIDPEEIAARGPVDRVDHLARTRSFELNEIFLVVIRLVFLCRFVHVVFAANALVIRLHEQIVLYRGHRLDASSVARFLHVSNYVTHLRDDGKRGCVIIAETDILIFIVVEGVGGFELFEVVPRRLRLRRGGQSERQEYEDISWLHHFSFSETMSYIIRVELLFLSSGRQKPIEVENLLPE